MANIEKFIPFLIYFETGVKDTSKSNEQLFEKAKAKGIANDPDDRGGATLVGITIGTYREYYRKSGCKTPTTADLINLSYTEWCCIFRSMFWNRWKADEIQNQKVAEMLVDWVWTSGKYGITLPQKLLGVKADGIVGSVTLAAVNGHDANLLFKQLKTERIAYTERICQTRPANMKFRDGWLRRINSLEKFHEAEP